MKEIKNISVKIVGVPRPEGGNKGLLPDETFVVDDKTAAQPGITILEEAGYIKVTNKYGKAHDKAEKPDEQAASADTNEETKETGNTPAAGDTADADDTAKKGRKASK